MDQFNFTRIITERPQAFSWFLGAGASRNADLPTADDIITDLKRRYYCTEENQSYSTKDVQNPAIRETIERYFQALGFPERWAPDEYTTYFEKIFGEDRERQRRYIGAMLAEDKVRLAVGNRVMGAMLASGMCRLVFTTNFDSVVEKSVAEMAGKSLSAFQIETASGAIAALNNEEFPIYCKLHGDFRQESLKNLSVDLASQNEELSKTLVSAATRFGFVVAGYSGRDESVMRLFDSALEATNAFPHGLYWLKIKGSETPTPVRDLIAKATEKGIDAHVVDIETYDTALLRIWRNLENVPDELDAKVRKGKAGIVSIPLPDTTGVKPILRMNALPVIQLPSNCLEVKTKAPLDWRSLKEILREAETDILATIDDGLIAWGEADEIASTFGSDFVGVSERSFDSDWRSTGRLSRKRFLEDALAKSFVRDRPVLFRRRGASAYLIIDKMAQDLGPIEALHQACGATTGTIPGLTVPKSDEYEAIHKVDFAEAARISLAYGDDRLWLLINPDIWIWPPRARKTAKNWLDRRRAGRRNDRHDAILSAWVSLLADDADRNKPFSVSLFDGEVTAQNPAFELVNRTGFAWKRGAP